MPRIGTPPSNTAVSHFGAPASDTLFGPPDRMIPTGRRRTISDIGVSNGTISE
jgi:hypothetical protein